MEKETVGFALCGSFCTFKKVIPQMKKLVDDGYKVIPIMSHTAYTTDTRFGKAEDLINEVESRLRQLLTVFGGSSISFSNATSLSNSESIRDKTLSLIFSISNFASLTNNLKNKNTRIEKSPWHFFTEKAKGIFCAKK